MKHPLVGVAAAVMLTVGLAGCSNADPEAQLRSDVREVIAAGNSEDTAELRGKAQELLSTIGALGGSGRITLAREAQLRELTLAVLRSADQLDVEPSASPSPPPSPSAAPSPSPSPSPPPSPTPPPSPSSTPSPDEDKGKDKDKPSPAPTGGERTPGSAPSPVVELTIAPSPTAS